MPSSSSFSSSPSCSGSGFFLRNGFCVWLM
jgi:hypothetical protein